MLNILFWIAVGAFIGWNLPQPTWAQFAQAKAVEMIEKFKGNKPE